MLRGLIFLSIVLVTICSAATAPFSFSGRAPSPGPCTNNCPSQTCNITILGAGAGGLSFAYYLIKAGGVSDPSQICFVEKNNYPGGRILDVALDASNPDLVYGTCALRINQNQVIPRCLAKALNVSLEEVDRVWRVHLRGTGPYGGTDGALLVPCNDTGYSVAGYPRANDGICSKYNLTEIQTGELDMTQTTPNDFLAECYYYDKMLNVDDGCGWEVIPPEDHPFTNGSINKYPDARAFTTDWLGYEQTNFMKDEDRFRSDFRSGINATSWVDFSNWDWNNNFGANFYPVGGWSAIMFGLYDYLVSQGVQFYFNENVTSVQSVPGNKYPLKVYTTRRLIISKYVVSTIPNKQFINVTGDVGIKLNNDPIFNRILPIESATVSVAWPFRWWDQFIPGNGTERIELRTIWTGLCLNSAEFPGNNYAKDQNVSRIAYVDDLECLTMWKYLATRPIQEAIDEILRELRWVFPEVDIPEPLNLTIKIQPVAWHFYGSGAISSNEQLFDYALEPIPGLPFSLVGETFHLQFSGWAVAAFTSALHLLDVKFGINISQFENCELCGPNELGLLTGTNCGTLPECDCSDPANPCFPQCSTLTTSVKLIEASEKSEDHRLHGSSRFKSSIKDLDNVGKLQVLLGPSR